MDSLVITLSFVVFIYFISKCCKSVMGYIQLCYAMRHVQGEKPHWLRGDIVAGFTDIDNLNRKKDMVKYQHYRSKWIGPFCGGVMVYCSKLTKIVLREFGDKSELGYNMVKPFFGEGLVTSNGLKWKHDRKMLNPVFHTSAMTSYIEVFNKATKTTKEKHSSKATMLTVDAFSKLSLDVITQCAFSMETHCQEDGTLNEYKNAVDNLAEIFAQRLRKVYYIIDWIFARTKLHKKQRQCLDILRRHAIKVISERRKQPSGNQESGGTKTMKHDFLDILLNSVNMKGDKLSDEEIIYHIHTFMIAGHEATSNSLAWLFFFLAKYQKIQDECREEVRKILGEREEISWEDVKKMEYVTMCIKETLRLRGPAFNLSRANTSPIKIKDFLGDFYKGKKNVTLPEATVLHVNLKNLHLNPEIWKKPDEFNPLRFNEQNSSKRSEYAFIPFSAGPRNCIGQHFAMLEMKIVTASLLKNMRFTLPEDFVDPGVKLEMVLKPSSDLCLKIDSHSVKN